MRRGDTTMEDNQPNTETFHVNEQANQKNDWSNQKIFAGKGIIY